MKKETKKAEDKFSIRKTDIEIEGRACLIVLAVFVCAILVVAAVLGAFWLVQQLITALC